MNRCVFFAPCPRGLERVLARELALLGATDLEETQGGVGFAGDWALCYRVNLESRVASRVLWRVAQGHYRSEEDIYRVAFAVSWGEWFGPENTLRVNVTGVRCPLKSLNFITLRIKDALCDKFRALTGRRPSVDTRNPDARVHAFLDTRELTLYLDTSGEPLFKRGLRKAAGDAPIRENLAAGILYLAGWRRGIPLLDPMCGSGTFLLEAAQMALGIPAGAGRHFAFQRLKNFDAGRWQAVQRQAQAARQALAPQPIYGADRDPQAVGAARANLAAAGLEGVVQLKQADVLDLSPPAASGILVANPPYGVRMGDEEQLAGFYPKLGDVLKRRFAGWRACLFTADPGLAKSIGLKASRRIPLYNGDLECRLLEYEIVAGPLLRRGKKVEA